MIDVGQTVGNYKITAKLGEGGMGTVFLAEHPVIGSKVALKAIHPQFAQNAEVFARFVNEAKAVNQIGHDHIIDITDFGIAPTGDCYFMMEYLEGETLSGAIERSGAFPAARALNIACQIADALSASHEHGVVHRDLKPANIFLMVHDGTQDFVKVLDFGLAKLTHADELGMYPARAETVMGTPYYMSPEQCEGRGEIDHRADVYALGVMLFEMLTGMIPFGGESYGELLTKHMMVPPPAARSIVPALSPALDTILFRALAKPPGDRFQSMGDFRQALQDPEGYASGTPLSEASRDMTERTRVALPMARTEMNTWRARGASHPQFGKARGRSPSTFHDTAGEVWVREDGPQPKRRRVSSAVLTCVAVAAVVLAGMKYRNQVRRFMAAAAALRKPATVRVSFNSDPDGATVVRADGTVLGVTPLSMDVAYGDKPTEYVVRLEGYLPSTTSVVPNHASPVYTVLQKDDPGPPVEAAAPEAEPAVAAVEVTVAPTPVTPKKTAARVGRRASPRYAPAPPGIPSHDGDDTLQPSAP